MKCPKHVLPSPHVTRMCAWPKPIIAIRWPTPFTITATDRTSKAFARMNVGIRGDARRIVRLVVTFHCVGHAHILVMCGLGSTRLVR